MPIQKILLSLLIVGIGAIAAAQSVATVRLDPPTFNPALGTTGFVYLSAPALANGQRVTLTSSNPAFVVPASVFFEAGQIEAKFSLYGTSAAMGTTTITATGGGTSRKGYAMAAYAGAPPSFERQSISGAFAQGSDHSGEPTRELNGDSRKISADGRYVVFTSSATNLVPNDRNRKTDVFLRDRIFGTVVRITEVAGVEGNGASYQPCISAQGKHVAFVSEASNLVANDTNNAPDVFVWDRTSGKIEMASRNGVTFGNDASFQPSISRDGRYVAYMSYASNLHYNDPNGWADIYVYDHTTGNSQRASVGYSVWSLEQPNGDCSGPSISADGRFVAFDSFADNLVPGDLNMCSDIFVRDLKLGTTTRASLDSTGLELDGFSFSPSISADGRIVAFTTYAPTVRAGDFGTSDAKVAIRNLRNSTTELASTVMGYDAVEPSISADGRFVAFANYSFYDRRFVSGAVYDRTYRNLSWVGGLSAWDLSLSADGRFVTLTSPERNFVPDDTNGKDDVFVCDLMGQQPVGLGVVGTTNQSMEVLVGDTFTMHVDALQASTSPIEALLSSSLGSVTLPSTVSIPAGALNAKFKVTTPETATEDFVTITASINSRTIFADVRLVRSQLVMSAPTVKAGQTLTGTLRVSTAPAKKAVIQLYSVPGVTIPATVNIPRDAKSKTFPIQIDANAQPGFYYVSGYGNGYNFNASFQVVP